MLGVGNIATAVFKKNDAFEVCFYSEVRLTNIPTVQLVVFFFLIFAFLFFFSVVVFFLFLL